MDILFSNPVFLYGMFLAGIPVIIHLFSKRSQKKISWAAMEFLRKAINKTVKKLRLQDWLLMLLRMIIIGVVVLVFARPVLESAGAGFATTSPKRLVVIVLDNSYSMGYIYGERTVYESAKEKAREVLDTLTSGSRVSVIFANQFSSKALDEPTFDIKLASKIVSDSSPSDFATDVQSALELAGDVITKSGFVNNEIYVISDFQSTDTLNPLASYSRKLISLSKVARLFLVDVAPDRASNIGITDVHLDGMFLPVIGTDVRMTVNVKNFSSTPVENVGLNVRIDGELKGTRVIESIEPGAERETVYSAIFDSPGYHSVAVTTGDDNLANDNSRYLTFYVYPAFHFLVIDGSLAEDREAYRYLSQALALFNRYKEGLALDVTIDSVHPLDLDTVNWADYDAAFLINVERLNATAVTSLERFVKTGGNVVIFAGKSVDTSFYNGDFFQNSGGLLPVSLGEVAGSTGAEKRAFKITGVKENNPSFSALSGNTGLFANMNVFKAYTVTERAADAGNIFTFDNGGVACVYKPYGVGKTVLFTFDLTNGWTDMPKRVAFVPVLHSVSNFLFRSKVDAHNVLVNGAFHIVAAATNPVVKVTVTNPKGENFSFKPNIKDQMIDYSFSDTLAAGIYTVTVEDRETLHSSFTVNVSSNEGDLQYLSRDTLDSFSGGITTLKADVDVKGAVEQSRSGGELWFYVLVGALGFYVFELILSSLFTKKT